MIKLYHERDVDGLELDASIKDIARSTLKILWVPGKAPKNDC